MPITGEELQKLYQEGEYRQVIETYLQWREELETQNPDAPVDSRDLRAAWAYYQLHELDQAKSLAMLVTTRFPETSEEGDSARRLWAHCAEQQGDLEAAGHLLGGLLPSSARDNLWITVLIGKQRKGEAVDPRLVMDLVMAAQTRTPYQVTDGHIVNNAVWLLHSAREQEGVKPFLSILPGIMVCATDIYIATGAAKNHRAGVSYRASIIFEAAGLLQEALGLIRESVGKWQELVKIQGGERYQQNLQCAERQLERLAKLIAQK